MKTSQIATITFIDQESSDDGVIIVRAAEGLVALSLSLKTDGDIDMAMRPSDCQSLMEALRQALLIANAP